MRQIANGQLRYCSTDDASEVVGQVALRTQQPFDFRTEQIQRKHIEGQMHEAAMQKAIADQLPPM